MKRESIIRLMWISLGIHVGYFLLEAIVAMGQSRNSEMYDVTSPL